ncbi:MAG: Ldh family oxidoreductase, partial [Treponema sp.]|nr:Ldh family oxidoreductase [Treponema sp.]
MAQTTDMIIFKEEQLRAWCTQALVKSCGVDGEYAFSVTDALVSSNLRGVDTHGVNLLQYYVRRYKTYVPNDIRITGDMPAVCHINGGGHMGPAVSVFAMNKAMEKAASAGVGMALVENSAHFGATGYYTC